MKHVLHRSLIAFVACLLVFQVWATEIPQVDPAEVGFNAKKLARIEKTVQAFVGNGEIAGAITLVARHGKIAHLQAYGHRNIANNLPMTTDSILRFYSMTKPITTVAALILWERGDLHLDAPVSRYLPELENLGVWQDDGDPVPPIRQPSIRDLMRHTSGLTYGFFGNHPVDKAYVKAGVLSGNDTSADLIDKLAKLPLMFEPGEDWNYSVSTDVLGRVVEVVSGQTLAEFFQDNIFDPLGLKDTAFWVPSDKIDRYATVYNPTPGGGIQPERDSATPSDRFLSKPAMFSGGGGLTSTARDYLRFCQMILNRGHLHGTRVLQDQTVRLMSANQVDPAAMPIGVGDRRPGQGFGLGFSVVVDPHDSNPGAVRNELGWGGAASTHFWISPDDDLVVIALQQFRPYSFKLEHAIKPLVYDAIER